MTRCNRTPLAGERTGRIAGMAASVVGAISTVLAALIASPVGLMFDGTTKPLALAMLCMAVVAYGLMLYMGRVENRLLAAAE